MKANSKLNPEWEKRSKELREQTNELINNQCHLDKVFYDENSISCAVMH